MIIQIISGHGSLSPEGKQAIAARGATVDLSDAVNANSLQTAGTIGANSAQREADISQPEAATHSSDPSQHTEMATAQAGQLIRFLARCRLAVTYFGSVPNVLMFS